MSIENSSFSVPGINRTGSLSPIQHPITSLFVDKIPPTPYTVRVSETNQAYTTQANNPGFEGQVCFYYDQENQQYPWMYVVVDINGTLTWSRVSFVSKIIDTNTGLPYDPLSQFYNPLSR